MGDPLPRIEIEARPDVHQMVADRVGDIPSKPGARKPDPDPDRLADDHLIDPANEREFDNFEAQSGGYQPEVDGNLEVIPDPEVGRSFLRTQKRTPKTRTDVLF